MPCGVLTVLLVASLWQSVSAKLDTEADCTADCWTTCVPSEDPNANLSQSECDKCSNGTYNPTDWTCSNGCVCPSQTDCKGAVSIDGITSNEVCSDACTDDAEKFKQLIDEGTCAAYGYRVDRGNTNRVVFLPEESCFDQWVHGYSDDGDYGKSNGKAQVGVIKEASDASSCQKLCQDDDTCVRFVYRVTTVDKQKEGQCLLKTEEMVHNAFTTSIFDGDQDTPAGDPAYEWCNMGLGYSCTWGGYKCAICKSKRCIFWSENHVAGPKYCGQPQPVCEGTPDGADATTTTSTTTTPEPTTTTTTTTPEPTTTTTPEPTTTTTTTTPEPTTTTTTTTPEPTTTTTTTTPEPTTTTTTTTPEPTTTTTTTTPEPTTTTTTTTPEPTTTTTTTTPEPTTTTAKPEPTTTTTTTTPEPTTTTTATTPKPTTSTTTTTPEPTTTTTTTTTTQKVTTTSTAGEELPPSADETDGTVETCTDDDNEDESSEKPCGCRGHHSHHHEEEDQTEHGHIRCGCCGQPDCGCGCGKSQAVKVVVEVK